MEKFENDKKKMLLETKAAFKLITAKGKISKTRQKCEEGMLDRTDGVCVRVCAATATSGVGGACLSLTEEWSPHYVREEIKHHPATHTLSFLRWQQTEKNRSLN